MTRTRRGKARRREVEEERRSKSEAYNWQIRRCLDRSALVGGHLPCCAAPGGGGLT